MTIPNIIFELGCPVLGICYGMQAMAIQLGGRVRAAPSGEFGYARLYHAHSMLLQGMKGEAVKPVTAEASGSKRAVLDVWMSHGDQVVALPEGFTCFAETEGSPIAAMGDDRRRLYGLQFHPEVTHTQQGELILSRFLHDVCGCASLWMPSRIIDDAIESIRQKVGDEHVILGLSGGVDSSVAAALLHRAIGNQLTCVFVDTGLLRLGEAKKVMSVMAEHMGVHIIHLEESSRFLSALTGVIDPEEKRKIIGREFIAVFESAAKRLPKVSWLAQGTIYPDVIESAGTASGKGHVIKSHHNVGGLPDTLNLKLLEPLRELFKDEVRRLGDALGLPRHMVYRHPFPGPGLGVRILGEVKAEYADLLRRADAIFIDALSQSGLYDTVSQAFAVFLPVKSVGVSGDARRYDYVISLRAVETTDFMTAQWARLPYDFLEKVSCRIVNEIAGISRVTYDISSKPPATIEWE